jgi:hypothetical protein
MRIRHRIGHVRRPHDDDLNRVEQALRDLEHGAFVARLLQPAGRPKRQ